MKLTYRQNINQNYCILSPPTYVNEEIQRPVDEITEIEIKAALKKRKITYTGDILAELIKHAPIEFIRKLKISS